MANPISIKLLYAGTTYIEQLVQSVEWSGDVTQPFRTLNVTFSNTLDQRDETIDFECGKELRFYVDNVGLFRGVIFSYAINDKGSTTITAYDENVYLTKNTDDAKFKAMTASAIVKSLCKTFSIPAGSIAETGYVIPKLFLRDMTVWDMIVTALTETRKHTNKKYFVYAKNGQLNMREKKESPIRWMLEDGVNILEANRTVSIEDMRTAVKAKGGTDEKPVYFTAKDDSAIAKYGLMQSVESADSDATSSQVQALAKEKLKELSKPHDEADITALGNVEVIAGSAIYAFESVTDLVGGFYVNADSHTFEAGTHKMNVKISKTDDLPKLEYEDNEEKKTKAKKDKKDAKKRTTNGGKRRTVKDVDKDVAALQDQITQLKKQGGDKK